MKKRFTIMSRFVKQYELMIEVLFGIIGGATFVFMTFATKTEVQAVTARVDVAEFSVGMKLDVIDCKLEDLLTKRNPRRACRPVYPKQIPEEE